MTSPKTKFSCALLATLFLASCSQSPEKAIEAMKKKADEYMLAGRKPTEEMIVADCSSYFKSDFKSDINWTSKLQVFEPILLEHIEKKELFDTTQKFPNSIITASTLRNANADSEYYYLHTYATVENVAYVNGNGEQSGLIFLLKDNNTGKITQERGLSLSIDIPWPEIVRQGVIGTPYVRVFSPDAGADVEPWDYYFYDSKTNHFDGKEIPFLGSPQTGRGLYEAILQISKNDTAPKQLEWTQSGIPADNNCTYLYYRIANENGAGLINDERAPGQISEKFSGNDYYVWEKSEDKRFSEPIGDMLTVSGVFELTGLKKAVIVKRDPGFDLATMKKVNFRTGKLL